MATRAQIRGNIVKPQPWGWGRDITSCYRWHLPTAALAASPRASLPAHALVWEQLPAVVGWEGWAALRRPDWLSRAALAQSPCPAACATAWHSRHAAPWGWETRAWPPGCCRDEQGGLGGLPWPRLRFPWAESGCQGTACSPVLEEHGSLGVALIALRGPETGERAESPWSSRWGSVKAIGQ